MQAVSKGSLSDLLEADPETTVDMQSTESIRDRIRRIHDLQRSLVLHRNSIRREGSAYRKKVIELSRNAGEDEDLAELIQRRNGLEKELLSLQRQIQAHIESKPEVQALQGEPESRKDRLEQIDRRRQDLHQEKVYLSQQLKLLIEQEKQTDDP